MIQKKGKQYRFGLQCLVLNDTDFMEAMLRSFQPFIDKILVSINEQSWLKDIKSDGKAEEIIKKLQKEFDNIHTVKGAWKNETDQRNHALDNLKECDYVFIVDVDEMWPTGSIHLVQDYALNRRGDITAFMANWNTRFKELNWRVDPREQFKPVVLIDNKKGLKFGKSRDIEKNDKASFALIPAKMLMIEHFSYVRSDDSKVKEKIQTFAHATEIVNGADWWYENIYLPANLKSKYLHPTKPESYRGLIEDSVHSEIERFLRKYSPQLFKE